MARFEKHGSLDVNWRGDVLHVSFAAPFNYEGALDACRIIEQEMCKSRNPWARIDIYENREVLAPIEAFGTLSKHIEKTKSLGCKAFCIIGCNVLVRDYFSNLFVQNSIPSLFCDAYEDAKRYVDASLLK